MAPEPHIGDLVSVPAGRGIIRFIGSTQFAGGKWIGIELYEGAGKNDGSVAGVEYFKCLGDGDGNLRGIFVKPSQVKVTESASAKTSTAVKRSSLSLSQAQTQALSRAASLRSTPSASSSTAASSRAASPAVVAPAATPNKRASVRLTSSSPSPPHAQGKPRPSSTVLRRPPSVVSKPRTSDEKDDSEDQRTVTLKKLTGATSPPPPPPPVSTPPAEQPKLKPPPSPLPRSASPLLSPTSSSPAPPKSPSPVPDSDIASTSSRPPSRAHPRAAPPAPASSEPSLETQLRLLQSKHAASLAHINDLTQRLNAAEQFVHIRPQLTSKLSSLQTTLQSKEIELSEASGRVRTLTNRIAEQSEILELAQLDKEVAEERAEVAEAERDELAEKLALAESELEALREDDELGAGGFVSGSQTLDQQLENAEGEQQQRTEGGPNGAGLGKKERRQLLMLEKQNERLKEVLVRLRDTTQETELEQRRKIGELERELDGIGELHSQNITLLESLQLSEGTISELKSQLDDALGAEEMLVQLTERNLQLTDKNEDLRLMIEELEQLKELADELEEHHVDTEKALQEEITRKDVQFHEQILKVQELGESIIDYENTISQFRELVGALQSDLEMHRQLSLSAQSTAASSNAQTSALLSINLKLQSSASKAQARHIETELLRLASSEANELLGIVQGYLPNIYVETDAESTNVYMFFVRMRKKGEVLGSVLGGWLSGSNTGPGVVPGGSGAAQNADAVYGGEVEEKVVGICEVRRSLSHLCTLCRRFTAIIKRCDSETFLALGRLHADLAPIERRIDIHIDLLKRDEFRDSECVADVSKMLSQFEHVAERYFSGYTFDLGERALDLVSQVDYDLDMVAAALGLTKTSLAKSLKDEDIIRGLEDPEIDFAEILLDPIQRLVDQCKGAKVLSKRLVKRVEDLIDDSGALKENIIPRLGALQNKINNTVDFGIQLAQSVGHYLGDVRSSKEPFNERKVLGFVREIATGVFGHGGSAGGSAWNPIADTLVQVAQDAGAVLPVMMEAENVVKITGIAPWIARISEVREQMAINVEADIKVAQLTEEIQNLARSIKSRDQTIQESTVKIELMERRLESAKKQVDTLSELESEIGRLRKEEKRLLQDQQQAAILTEQLENENAQLKIASASGHDRRKSASMPVEVPTMLLEGNLETSYLVEQIEALRGTVRFLRSENQFIRSQGLLRELQELPQLHSRPPRTPPTPPLEPATVSDSDDSDFDSIRTPPKPTHRSLTIESKLLYRDYIDFASSAKVVDLSVLNKNTNSEGPAMANGDIGPQHRSTRAWIPRKMAPAHLVEERRRKSEQLRRRLDDLLTKAQSAGITTYSS